MVKKIHYCCFGKKQKSPLAEKCIGSWRRYFPDFEIIEWNEDNFNVNANEYTKQAYEAGKYAFVSDYARFYILERYGGLYFDTDVEVIRPFGDFLTLDAFAGFENDKMVAPGLVLYAGRQHHPIIVKACEYYENASFSDENGERIRKNVCDVFTEILLSYGLVQNGQKQLCGGMTVFPNDYFCPFDDTTGRLRKTENTYSVHWYSKSWMSKRKIVRNKLTRVIHRIFGSDIRQRLSSLRKR